MAWNPFLSWSRRLVGVTPQMKDSQEHRTDSGIEIQPVYRAEDLAGWDPETKLGEPGSFPYTRGVHAEMYRSKLWTMRQYAGFGSAESTNERFKFLLDAGQTGLSCAFDLPDPDGLRLGPPAGRGRGRQGGCGHRLAGRHAAPHGRPADGQGDHVDDHQRHGRHPAPPLRAGGGGAGRPGRQDPRHHPERHPEGVHRPGDVYLPTPALDAADRRHVLVLRRQPAELEHDLDFRLPHPRGGIDGGTGDRLHVGQRHRVRGSGDRGRYGHRRLRPAAVVLLERPQQPLRGGGQVPGRPPHVGAHHDGALRGQGSAQRRCCVSTPRPADRR